MAFAPLLAIASVAAVAALPVTPPPLRAHPPLCTLVPGATLALVRVEQDTVLPFALGGVEPMSMSSVRPGPHDSLLATPSTPMPAGRVRLLEVDSATRTALSEQGITDRQPTAFIRAAPYRADCRTIRWTDTVPFVVRGELGYVRATLAPRDRWISGVPVLVIPDVWSYPYPRRRGLAYGVAPNAPLASAPAMFSLNAVLEIPRSHDRHANAVADSMSRARAMAWARANPVEAELEPIRTLLRRAVLAPDWDAAQRIPSRLRGTYRVDLEVEGHRSTWFFRTHERPGYGWRGRDSLQTTAQMLASPHVAGYRLVGYAGGSRDSIPNELRRGARRIPLVWLATTDRPTAPGHDAQHVLPSVLEFTLAAVPEPLWNDLEALVPPSSARDSAMMARMNFRIERGEKQPQIPLTVRLDGRGGIRADTTLLVGKRRLRVAIERVDTLTVRRPF